jgi:bacillithiol system protein YtxJ
MHQNRLIAMRYEKRTDLKTDKMNRFSSLFKNTDKQNPAPKIAWIALDSLQQLAEITTTSETQPVIIFKHSTRCGISRMALKQFENEFNQQDKVTPYFLDLLAYRAISNAVAERFQVAHQSPQLLVIKAGKAVYDAAHGGIDGNLVEWV